MVELVSAVGSNLASRVGSEVTLLYDLLSTEETRAGELSGSPGPPIGSRASNRATEPPCICSVGVNNGKKAEAYYRLGAVSRDRWERRPWR
jgi:hypothetical protein